MYGISLGKIEDGCGGKKNSTMRSQTHDGKVSLARVRHFIKFAMFFENQLTCEHVTFHWVRSVGWRLQFLRFTFKLLPAMGRR